jgi:hypothetical protein
VLTGGDSPKSEIEGVGAIRPLLLMTTVLLVAAGPAWSVLTQDKLGLVVAFAGVILLAYAVLKPACLERPMAKYRPFSEASHAIATAHWPKV